MKNEENIRKWLEGTLSHQEKEEFESSKDFQQISKLFHGMEAFKAPEYDVEKELLRLKDLKTKEPKVVQVNWLSQLTRVAAAVIFIVGLIYIFYPSNSDTMVHVSSHEISQIQLPDSSTVRLNAESYIYYDQDKWQEERKVLLVGEAYFEVAEGSLFEVETESGSIQILGTVFNVRDREGHLEVTCYEGHVKVEAAYQSTDLFAGQKIWFSEGAVSGKTPIKETAPSWLYGESSFESIPYIQVLKEFERQYEVSISSNYDVNVGIIFTGSFTHGDLEIALKSITMPLNLTYQIAGDQIVLSNANP